MTSHYPNQRRISSATPGCKYATPGCNMTRGAIVVVGFYWPLGSKQMQFIKHYYHENNCTLTAITMIQKYNILQNTHHTCNWSYNETRILLSCNINIYWLPNAVIATTMPRTVAPRVVVMTTHSATGGYTAVAMTASGSQWKLFKIFQHIMDKPEIV